MEQENVLAPRIVTRPRGGAMRSSSNATGSCPGRVEPATQKKIIKKLPSKSEYIPSRLLQEGHVLNSTLRALSANPVEEPIINELLSGTNIAPTVAEKSNTTLSPDVSPRTSPNVSPRTSPRTEVQTVRLSNGKDEVKTFKRRSNTDTRLVFGGDNIPSINGSHTPRINRSPRNSIDLSESPSPMEGIEQEVVSAVTEVKRRCDIPRLSLTERRRRVSGANLCIENPLTFAPENISTGVVPLTDSRIVELGFKIPDKSLTSTQTLEDYLLFGNDLPYEEVLSNPLYNVHKARDLSVDLLDEADTLLYSEIVYKLLEKGQDPNNYELFKDVMESHKDNIVDKLSLQQRKCILERKRKGSAHIALVKPLVTLLSRPSCVGYTSIGEPVPEELTDSKLFEISSCSKSWKLQKISISRNGVDDNAPLPNWRTALGRRKSYVHMMEHNVM